MNSTLLPQSPPRLNPFAFPSDTTLRFGLLITFVLCGSLTLYGMLWTVFHQTEAQAFSECADKQLQKAGKLNLSELIFLSAPPATDPVPGYNAWWRDLAACDPEAPIRATWRIVGTILTFSLAIVLYGLFPRLRIRWQRLLPLQTEGNPALAEELMHLCQQIGVRRCPAFMLAPLEPRVRAVAFGHLGQYYVFLSLGLYMSFTKNQAVFRAVVLHELAHLRNADVDKTYFTLAMLLAFCLTPIIPSYTSVLWNTLDGDDTYLLILYSTVIAALVTVSGGAVLRAREFYADVRASVGETETLICGLTALHHSAGGLLGGLLHPKPSDREKIIWEPSRLFDLGFWDTLAAGIAAAMVMFSAALLMSNVVVSNAETITQSAEYQLLAVVLILSLISLVSVPLAIGAVGIGVWRGAFAALMQGSIPKKTGHLAFALALGLLLGGTLVHVALLFSPLTIPAGYEHGKSGLVLILGTAEAFAFIVLAVFFWILFHWLATTVSTWIGIVLFKRSPRPVLRASVFITILLSMTWMGLVITLAVTGAYTALDPPDPTHFATGLDTAIFLTAAGFAIHWTCFILWAFPLAAWFWLRRTTFASPSSWVFLDGRYRHFSQPTSKPLQPKLALVIGLAMGVICHALWFTWRFSNYLPPEVAGYIRELVLPSVVQTRFRFFAAPTLLQALAAAISAGWISYLGPLHGLFSASITGYVISVGWFLLYEPGGLSDGLIMSTIFLSLGVCLALPVSLLVGRIARLVRRFVLRKETGSPIANSS